MFKQNREAGIVSCSLPSISDDKVTNRSAWFVDMTPVLTLVVLTVTVEGTDINLNV